ncbi:MAG TPA: LuxR C-terminal-related transcriptional regulator [Thermoanaerobaculia bacterium]
MVVTTPERSRTKLERKVFEPLWLRAVLDDGDAGFLIEADEEIAYVNRAYTALLGYDYPAQLRGQHLSLIVAQEDAPRLLTFSRMRVREEPAPRNYVFAARRRDDSVIRLRASVSAARMEGAVVIATMVLPDEGPATAAVVAPIASLAADTHGRLSPRETEVMEMILAGKRMKEIAHALDVSPKTVSTHRTRLMQKLGLTSIRDLFQYALTHHLIDWS